MGYIDIHGQKNFVSLDANNLPKSLDWRAKGAVTPVKNQKMCGSCWAFSATGALEGLNFITNGKLISFSEQQLVDCSRGYGNDGCGGGLMDYAFNYTKDFGIQNEVSYPYADNTNKCTYSKNDVLFKNKGWVDVPENDLDQLAAAVTLQPISVGIEADNLPFMLYIAGVYNYPFCGTSLDHGVLVVGYGTSIFGNDYWLVKNSWGSWWGEGGYIKMKKSEGKSPGTCGIAKAASYPTMKENLEEKMNWADMMNALVNDVKSLYYEESREKNAHN